MVLIKQFFQTPTPNEFVNIILNIITIQFSIPSPHPTPSFYHPATRDCILHISYVNSFKFMYFFILCPLPFDLLYFCFYLIVLIVRYTATSVYFGNIINADKHAIKSCKILPITDCWGVILFCHFRLLLLLIVAYCCQWSCCCMQHLCSTDGLSGECEACYPVYMSKCSKHASESLYYLMDNTFYFSFLFSIMKRLFTK